MFRVSALREHREHNNSFGLLAYAEEHREWIAAHQRAMNRRVRHRKPVRHRLQHLENRLELRDKCVAVTNSFVPISGGLDLGQGTRT